jgi:hypothetical protein
MAFWIFGGLFLLYSLINGWRRGVVRQSLSVFAVVAGYFAGVFGGRLLMPILRGLGYPDFALSLLAGAVMGLLVYLGVSALGTILFKKTNQQDIFFVRWGYGLGGALVGAVFGALLLWVALIGLRLAGTVAETEVKLAKGEPGAQGTQRTQTTKGTKGSAAIKGTRTTGAEPPRPDPGVLAHTLAKLKHSVDESPVGEYAQKVDPLPGNIYSMMRNLTLVLSNPDSVERLLEFPEIRELTDNSKIRSLMDDPEIARAGRDRSYWDLLRNPKVVEALNDPAVQELVKKVHLEKALDYASKTSGTPAPTPEEAPKRKAVR